MPFLEPLLEAWNKVIAVNLTGPWLGCRETPEQLVSQGGLGRIINISSVHKDLPMPTNSPYCAAKGGLRMLRRTIAVGFAPYGITVNNIPLGSVETPMDAPLDGYPDEMNKLLSEITMGWMCQPEEITVLAVYLATDASTCVNGSTFIRGGV